MDFLLAMLGKDWCKWWLALLGWRTGLVEFTGLSGFAGLEGFTGLEGFAEVVDFSGL